VRRRAPRPLSLSLAPVAQAAAPATTLARVQACWTDAVGDGVAAETEPASERDGVLTVRCSSSVWAEELHLLSGELLPRLNAVLAVAGAAQVVRMRFVTGSLVTPMGYGASPEESADLRG
jgi:predicted nucleic acid-binding Zn ribbon protein